MFRASSSWTPGRRRCYPLLHDRAVLAAVVMTALQGSATAKDVLFGDFERAYLITDVSGMWITLGNKITTPDRIKCCFR